MMPLLCLLFAISSFASVLDTLANKKLVAIGESGHAVAEFHRHRGEISKRFIEKHGFRNIFIEEDLLAGFNLAEAIDSCGTDHDPAVVRKAFSNFDSSTYRHEEFYKFYEFLCDWNKAHPSDPVRLYGIDVWSNYWDLSKYFEAKFSTLEIKPIIENFLIAKNHCFLWSINSLSEYPTHVDWVYYEKFQRVEPTRQATCLAALYQLKSLVQKNAAKIPQVEKIQMALDVAQTQQQIRDAYTFDFPKAMNLRDANQARNQMNIMKMIKSDAGSILLSHNVHVFTKMSQVLPREITTPYPWAHVISAGEWLKSYYGENMAVIAMGGYALESLRDGAYPLPTSPLSIDVQLHATGAETAIVKSSDYPGEWWVHNETEAEGLWLKPTDQFDFYFFIDYSKPATAWKL